MYTLHISATDWPDMDWEDTLIEDHKFQTIEEAFNYVKNKYEDPDIKMNDDNIEWVFGVYEDCDWMAKFTLVTEKGEEPITCYITKEI